MSEYIITVDETRAGFDGNMPISAKQEVVRCRDCKHMHTVRSWLGMDVDECWLHAEPETGALGKNRTEPDGFCLWGERHAD